MGASARYGVHLTGQAPLNHRLLISFLSWRPGAFARDGARIFFWLGLRAAFQAVTVVLLARWLGASGYGVFVAALAVASFFTPIAAMGMPAVLLRDGARHCDRLPWLLMRSLRLSLLAIIACVIMATLAQRWSLPPSAPLWALVFLAAGEIAGGAWTEIFARTAQAKAQSHRFGAILAGLAAVRLSALLFLAALGPPTPCAWMLAFGLSSLVYVALLTLGAWPLLGHIKQAGFAPTTWKETGPAVREGFPFVTGALAFRLQAEFNKPVLAHLGYAQAGAFSIAQRAVDFAALPLAALQEALWPRFFAAANPRQRAIRTGALLVLLAAATGSALALAAPLLPSLLGHDYQEAGQVLVWLALLPALQVCRNLGNAWLMALGYSHLLTVVYVLAAVAGVTSTLMWVPRYGLHGAMAAAYSGDLAAIFVQALALYGKSDASKTADPCVRLNRE
ncbi:MAG: lipopolysaccharide biosynthesis protein [Desulfosoma sp.]